MYKGRAEPMLVLLLNSYSDNDSVLVHDSKSSSSPAYIATGYCPKKKVCYFDLRRLFYSRQLF